MLSAAMAYSLDENDCTWNEMLPSNPMFDKLRDKGGLPTGNANILCEIRGDLFVWSDAEKVLLTTNLKRLMAYHSKADQVYQVCKYKKSGASLSCSWFLPHRFYVSASNRRAQ